MPSSNKSSNCKLVSEIDWKAPPCEPGKCRTNCRKNPNCFFQLGEKFWFNPIKESFWISTKDPENERKDENGHVGLKNLGATCYVNTFLQLWFTNRSLCSAVYKWKTDAPPTEIENEVSEGGSRSISLSFGDDSTKAICGNLQYIFALLQYSERRYVDPSSFVESLGLQTNEQQDAQEFNKLFISLLDSSLLDQGINIIDRQFGGTYCYRTKCSKCDSISDRPSKFYELDLNIKGHFLLKKCLSDFLKEETLDGDNQYFCSCCQRKCDATRKIVLQKLPRVLNLQLLRFVFDRQTFTKKKLNNTVAFPDTLDMNEFVELENKNDGIYKLTAVLIHRGLSANSGHYIAHIWDKENGHWCRFNDEDVQVMKSKTLELGKEDDLEGNLEGKGKSKDKEKKDKDGNKNKKAAEKDSHSSKNSYMLVYTKIDETNDEAIEPPDHIMEIVAKDNSLFEQWVRSVKEKRCEALANGIEKQKEIQAIYACLPVQGEENFDWISTKWLRNWLSNDHSETPPIDNTGLMCPHSCADPSKFQLMKRVSQEAADALFEKYGGLPRFKSDSLCTKCLEFLKKKKEFFNKLNNDVKILTKCLKQSYNPSGDRYWVGRRSLKQFKQLATQEFMISFDLSPNHGNVSNNAENSDTNNNDDSQDASDENNLPTPVATTTIAPKKNTLSGFNLDATCQDHGNLILNESVRTLVSKDDWKKCLEYFSNAKEFPIDAPTCVECQAIQKSNEAEKEIGKKMIAIQKQTLSFLNGNPLERISRFLSKNRGTLHVIQMDFVDTWKKRMKSGRIIPEEIDNSDMICEHDLLLYTAEEIIDEASKSDPEIMLIDDEEKLKIDSLYKFQPLVSINMIKATNDIERDGKQVAVEEAYYECIPTFCPDCRSLRLAEEAFDSKSYENAAIYVQKLTGEQHNYTVDESKKLANEEEEETDIDNIVVSDEPSFKHQKRESSASQETQFVPSKKMKTSDENNTRRSARHRRKRGEYVVYINSSHTLKQLKVQLLSLFSVFPLEQVLTFEDGMVLLEDDKQLVDLGVRPGMHLYLSVAELTEDQLKQVDQDSGKDRVIEAGFKGTNLVCS